MTKCLAIFLIMAPLMAHAGWVNKGYYEDDGRTPQTVQDKGETVCAWPVYQVWEYQLGAKEEETSAKKRIRTLSSVFCSTENGACPQDVKGCLAKMDDVKVQAASATARSSDTEDSAGATR